MKKNHIPSRRGFIKGSALLTAGIASGTMIHPVQASASDDSDNIYLVGPQDGYSPRIGTLLSTMTMMRVWVVRSVENLTQEELDFQLDDQSNSIGAMLLHLAATERYYQLNTFDEMEWGSWSDEIKKEWDVPMGLGETGRKEIVGNDIDFYLSKLEEVRETTKKEFAKRDDDWLMKSEPFFENKPTNNHCKWFHVCEHESNHNGQIKFIKKRISS
ncbi:MAG: DinB family protein [Saprospiraceae bacterium]|nr:DinB family protein [Saprospiraceae bacterium]